MKMVTRDFIEIRDALVVVVAVFASLSQFNCCVSARVRRAYLATWPPPAKQPSRDIYKVTQKYVRPEHNGHWQVALCTWKEGIGVKNTFLKFLLADSITWPMQCLAVYVFFCFHWIFLINTAWLDLYYATGDSTKKTIEFKIMLYVSWHIGHSWLWVEKKHVLALILFEWLDNWYWRM